MFLGFGVDVYDLPRRDKWDDPEERYALVLFKRRFPLVVINMSVLVLFVLLAVVGFVFGNLYGWGWCLPVLGLVALYVSVWVLFAVCWFFSEFFEWAGQHFRWARGGN